MLILVLTKNRKVLVKWRWRFLSEISLGKTTLLYAYPVQHRMYFHIELPWEGIRKGGREGKWGRERELCATMLLGQANVVRHCALAKACFALAFDSQVQCRECPLNVGPPASSCCCCCCCTASPSDVYIYCLPMTRVLTLELFWEKKEFYGLTLAQALCLFLWLIFLKLYIAQEPSMTTKIPLVYNKGYY